MTRARALLVALGALSCSGLSACSASVAGGLDETQADRVVVALTYAGMTSEKEADPTSEGRFRVLVAHDDAPRAIAALRDEELPPQSAPSALDGMGRGALIPSPLAEHAQYVAGLAFELERTLDSVDGILTARVHLSLPQRDPLCGARA
jgi:type III secretion protein J